MRIVLLAALGVFLSFAQAAASDQPIEAFGIKIGVTTLNELPTDIVTSHLTTSSAAWIALYQVDISSLPDDPVFSHHSLQNSAELIEMALTVDGIDVIFDVHLIYKNLPIDKLVEILSQHYQCEPSGEVGYWQEAHECTKGANSYLARYDADSGWSHAYLRAPRPEAGKKPKLD